MGQFSWLDCRNGKQVVDDKREDVYVLIPKEFGGGRIKEECYDGYGNFGGHDIYELVVDWNAKYIDYILAMKHLWFCKISDEDAENMKRFHDGLPISCEKRWIGIILACYDKDNFRLPYPIKITHDPYAVYEFCDPSPTDPDQGWEDEGECDWENDDYWHDEEEDEEEEDEE